MGLNFFPESVRYVDPTSPQTVGLSRLAVDAGLKRIGVFVNEDSERIAEVVASIGLEAVQLHGDESVEIVAPIQESTGIGVIRAIKLPTGKIAVNEIAAKVDRWIEAGCHLLFDADAGSAHGGSGQVLDWPSVAAWAAANPQATWTLAGGLNPENVGEAIVETGARSVDVASGVEETRGVKSEWLVRRFVVEARAALEI